jgi:hypothetical protein
MTRFVVPAFLVFCLIASAPGATAQNTPKPLPTILVSLPPAAPTPTPDPAASLRVIGRVRVTACANERKMAETAVIETAHSDGVVVGVMQRLGDTRFTLNDLASDIQPSYIQTPPPAGVPNLPTPLPFTTPIQAVEVAQSASKPYWTGTRKLLDASGDLEKSVRAAAAAVDKLQAVANTDPDPERRKKVQETIKALTDAVIRQAPLVKKINEFVLKADTNLAVAEMRNVGSMGGSNPQGVGYDSGVLLNNDPQSDGYKLLHESRDAHEATVKAVKSAQQLTQSAFSECPPAPRPQATAR